MPNIVITGTSADVLNAIRNHGTVDYRSFVPYAAADAGKIKEIGAVIMQMPMLQNEFMHNLINLIGSQIVTSKLFNNPWRSFKRATNGYGATEEEIFIDLAKGASYDPGTAESKVFERELPDIRAAFHTLNARTFYKTTVQQADLRQAFLTESGIVDLVAKITEALYTSANYDEFCTMKYLLASAIINGHVTPVDVSSTSTGETLLKEYATAFKTVSNKMEFLSTNYNMAGVHNHSLKSDQYLIMNAASNAEMDVNVLAAAFNMDKAEFMGHIITVDDFGTNDYKRLDDLFGTDDIQYEEPNSSTVAALNAIPAVIVDADFFRVYDNQVVTTEVQNPQGLYWNYFLHVWKTYSFSPFANAAVFVPDEPGITSVTVSPSSATAADGDRVIFTASVAYTGFAPHGVKWSITGASEDDTYIDSHGVLHLADGETGTLSAITVTATSAYDSTVSDTATVTVT